MTAFDNWYINDRIAFDQCKITELIDGFADTKNLEVITLQHMPTCTELHLFAFGTYLHPVQ